MSWDIYFFIFAAIASILWAVREIKLLREDVSSFHNSAISTITVLRREASEFHDKICEISMRGKR